MRQRIQVDQPAHLFGLAAGGHGFVDGDDVSRLGAVDELDDVLEDDAVIVAVKVFSADEVGDTVPGCVVQQQAAQHRLLGLDGVGRHTERIELGVR